MWIVVSDSSCFIDLRKVWDWFRNWLRFGEWLRRRQKRSASLKLSFPVSRPGRRSILANQAVGDKAWLIPLEGPNRESLSCPLTEFRGGLKLFSLGTAQSCPIRADAGNYRMERAPMACQPVLPPVSVWLAA